MQQQFVKFLINTGIFSSVVAICSWLVFHYVLSEYYLPIHPYAFGFVVIVTVAFYYIILRISQLKPAKFVNFFMGATTVKLMIYLAIILIFVFIQKENAKPFLLFFLVLYLLFTVFEVVSILSQFKDRQKDKVETNKDLE